jgi:hypothetical protein
MSQANLFENPFYKLVVSEKRKKVKFKLYWFFQVSPTIYEDDGKPRLFIRTVVWLKDPSPASNILELFRSSDT